MYVKRRSPPSSAQSSANASIRRVPSTLIVSDAPSGRSKDTDAAPCTISETCAGDLERDVGVQAEAVVRDVAGERAHPVEVGLRRAERAGERLLQARAGVLVVGRADEDEDVAVGELQVAREQLDPDEAGRAGEQDGVAGGRGGEARGRGASVREPAHAASASASSSSIASPMPCAMRSASSASSACA